MTSRFDRLIGLEATENAAIDIDMIRDQVILVPQHGKEIRLTREQAHTLALGLIKAKALLDSAQVARG